MLQIKLKNELSDAVLNLSEMLKQYNILLYIKNKFNKKNLK